MHQTPSNWLTAIPFAHRGLHDGNVTIPENSLPAFQNAIDNHFSIEFDVHLLADGHIAVFHDDVLERMCAVKKIIANETSVSLKEYNLKNSSEKIPLLPEVLELVQDKVPLLIEIKKQKEGGKLEAALLPVLKQYKGRYAIQSFNPFSLAWFVKHAPNILRGQLASDFNNEKLNFFAKYALKHFIFTYKSKPDFIAYDSADMPNERVAKFRHQGLPILCWTIRSLSEFERIKQYCDNVIFESFRPSLHDRTII